MNRYTVLLGATLVLGAIAYALGHYMEREGIRTQADSHVVAQEKAAKRD